MSLHNLARHVQSQGRGDDKMLVHMTPGEVKGLQSLAMAHGGSLSINPNTGLPEAGFLKNILPTVVGGAAMMIPGMQPIGAAMIGGGLGLAMSGGNLKQGILGGLGAWGGASLVGGLMGAGSAAGAGALGAKESAAALGKAAIAGGETTAGMVGAANTGLPIGTETLGGTVTSGGLGGGSAVGAATPSNWDQLVKGYQATPFNSSYLKQNMFPIGAAVAPALLGSTDQQYGTTTVDQGQIKPYTYSQTRNPEFGMVPGAPYFKQTFTAGTPYAAKRGGIVELADGGVVERMSDMGQQPGMYPQGMMDKTYYATPTQRPASMEVIGADYDAPVSPMTGLGRPYAGGGIVALADGGTFTDIDQLAVAPDLGRYSKPAPAVNPSVIAYNKILADRAANEYVVQPPPLTMLPGGGERASAPDTSRIINQYYLSQLGRQADQPGLEYWTKQKMDSGMSLADIKNAIAGSPEGQVRQMYQTILGRTPDAEGAQYWQQQLAGGMTPEAVRQAIMGSAEAKARPATAAAAPATPSLGGYSYDPMTGQYTKAPEPPKEDFTGFMSALEDPGFKNWAQQNLYNQYLQSQQPQYAAGGGISDLGGYSDGGRLLKGPGDGVSDSIPAQIGARQPARLADGEFVVPARIVSELGNGSTDAGARKLYSMMDRIQKKRRKSIGKDKVAVDSKAESVLPA